MLAHGNGNVEVCVRNLLSTIRGEAPLDRCRGLDADLTDRPAGDAAGLLAADAVWVLDNYEPRAGRKEVMLAVDDALRGAYTIEAAVSP